MVYNRCMHGNFDHKHYLPGLPSRTFVRTVSSESELLGFSFSLFFRYCAVRYTKLAISSAFERT